MRPGLCLLTPGPSAHPARSAGPPVPALLPTPFTCRSRRRLGVGLGPCWSRREPPQAEGEAHAAWVASAQGRAPGSWLRFPANRPQGRVCSRAVTSLGAVLSVFPSLLGELLHIQQSPAAARPPPGRLPARPATSPALSSGPWAPWGGISPWRGLEPLASVPSTQALPVEGCFWLPGPPLRFFL